MNEDLVLKLCSKNAEILILEERCKKLREALEFYADKDWEIQDEDGGKRAREALKEAGEE